MIVRKAQADSPEARSLLNDYFSWWASAFPTSSGDYTVTYPRPEIFEPPRGIFLIAEDDATGSGAIGCGGIRRIDDDAGLRRFEVKHVWLSPACRGRGLANSLLNELETHARSFGADALVLDTHESLTDAARLYARLEFVRVEAYNDNPNATAWYSKNLDRV